MPYAHVEKHKTDRLNEFLIIGGGFFFALIAGFVNLVFLEAGGLTLSHMTGNVSRLSDALYHGSDVSVAHFLIILTAFVAGAALSGLVIGDGRFALGRRYAYLIFLEGALLASTCFLVQRTLWASVYLAAFAMGLQNAMASSYQGLIIRTTHMTGILTDMGFLFGSSLRRRRILSWKLVFFVCVLAGFFVGGWAGMLGYFSLGIWCLLFPAGLLVLAGVAHLAGFGRLRKTASS